MLSNFMVVAWRNLRNGRIYSVIQLLGLAIGLTCSLLIFLYVAHETSYDRFHSKADRIYRVNEFFAGENGTGERSSSIPFPFGETMALDYNGMVENFVRVFDFQSPALTIAYEPREKIFNERNFFFVDSTYSSVFDLHLTRGNPATALRHSNSVVLSESMARKYFGDEEPVGKLLLFQNQADLLVTGVFPDMPSNTHFHADFLASFSTLRSFYDGQYPPNWHWNPCWTYLLLKENADPKALEKQFPSFVQKHLPASFRDDVTLALQPMTSIHLDSHLEFEMEGNGSRQDVYLFTGIAIFVLLVACINFMNLSTARSVKRAKEVGLRKAVGSQPYQLVLQFMLESVLVSLMAVVLAVLLVAITLPYFNSMFGRQLSFNLLDPLVLSGLAGVGLCVGILSGIYPAFVLTSFQTVKVLKANLVQGKGLHFRKALVVVQFVISMVLIVGTGVAVTQLNFLQESPIGFTKEHIIMIPAIGTPIAPKYRTFVDEAMRFSGVESVTALEEILGSKHQGGPFQFEGMANSNLFSRIKVRHDFLKTFQIPLVAGRDYSIDVPTDDSLAVVVNESLVKEFHWTPAEALGKRCRIGNYQAEIIGVAKDFHFTSKHEPMGSLVIQMNNTPGSFRLSLKYLAVRVTPESEQKAIDALRHLWTELLPGYPFDYFFLDNELNNLYQAEAHLITIALTFSVLAILIACMGLFGLASFNAEQRKREISIRKVLGSSVKQIIILTLSEYFTLLLIAIAVACPLGWYAMHLWLTTFAYHVAITPGIFILAALLTISIALLTVSYKSFSVARSNPVDALRE